MLLVSWLGSGCVWLGSGYVCADRKIFGTPDLSGNGGCAVSLVLFGPVFPLKGGRRGCTPLQTAYCGRSYM